MDIVGDMRKNTRLWDGKGQNQYPAVRKCRASDASALAVLEVVRTNTNPRLRLYTPWCERPRNSSRQARMWWRATRLCREVLARGNSAFTNFSAIVDCMDANFEGFSESQC